MLLRAEMLQQFSDVGVNLPAGKTLSVDPTASAVGVACRQHEVT